MATDNSIDTKLTSASKCIPVLLYGLEPRNVPFAEVRKIITRLCNRPILYETVLNKFHWNRSTLSIFSRF